MLQFGMQYFAYGSNLSIPHLRSYITSLGMDAEILTPPSSTTIDSEPIMSPAFIELPGPEPGVGGGKWEMSVNNTPSAQRKEPATGRTSALRSPIRESQTHHHASRS